MKQQRGGTFLGFVLGLVVGLGVALAVAVYVTKVPVPFLDKGANRPADQDAVEQQKNKNWDPNAPLYGKNPIQPAASAEQIEPVAPQLPASAPKLPASEPELKPAVTADPLGDLVKSKMASPKSAASQAGAPEQFLYFVQVGAYRTVEDAESQRAKLSLAGIETKLTEREQAGSKVYRVRTGPFEQREDAEKAKAKLVAVGQEAALVRVAR